MIPVLEVVWPLGRSERFEDLPVNARVTIEEAGAGQDSRVTVKVD